MAITEDDVRHIARLCSLAVAEEKMGTFRAQFQSILAYMDILNAVDTASVEPLYSPLEAAGAGRPDEARRTATPAEVLQNAPEAHETFYAVPRIV